MSSSWGEMGWGLGGLHGGGPSPISCLLKLWSSSPSTPNSQPTFSKLRVTLPPQPNLCFDHHPQIALGDMPPHIKGNIFLMFYLRFIFRQGHFCGMNKELPNQRFLLLFQTGSLSGATSKWFVVPGDTVQSTFECINRLRGPY